MNEILQDLKLAIESIPKFYYEMPNVQVKNNELELNKDDLKYYERRFVSQLKSEYDNIIKNGSTENYYNVNTDIEVIKKYICNSDTDSSIVAAYKKLSGKNDNKAFDAIITIPDFFIHKQQDNFENTFQKLVVEVKTAQEISEIDIYLDLFKINVYVEKYNFQNGVFLVINNDKERVKQLAKKYLRDGIYIAPTNNDKIYLFLKPTYKAEIEIIKLIDL